MEQDPKIIVDKFMIRSKAVVEAQRQKNRAKRRRQGRGGYGETQAVKSPEYSKEEILGILQELEDNLK